MTLPLRVRSEADADLQEAVTWYEQQTPGLGNAFLDEVLATFGRIAEHPEIYAILHRQTRRALTERFPFGVYYRVETMRIVVVAVIHGSRDPQHWMDRT